MNKDSACCPSAVGALCPDVTTQDACAGIRRIDGKMHRKVTDLHDAFFTGDPETSWFCRHKSWRDCAGEVSCSQTHLADLLPITREERYKMPRGHWRITVEFIPDGPQNECPWLSDLNLRDRECYGGRFEVEDPPPSSLCIGAATGEIGSWF